MRALVVRLGALGDIVHTIPAAAALARRLGPGDLDWLVDARHRAALELFELPVRAIAIAPGQLGGALATVRALRRARYDVAVDFQGLIKSAVLARLSGATRVVGFSRQALREPAAGAFYSERVTPPRAGHVIAKNLALAHHLGAEGCEARVPLRRLPLPELAARGGLELPYAIVNPGGGWTNKRWPAARLGQVAAGLLAERGVRSLVVWGPGERELADAVVASSAGAARLAPATDLPGLAALLQHASLVVSGDTGPLHLAAAAGTPIVGIYGPTDPARNGPWAPDDVCVSRFAECGCHHKRRCTQPSWCLDSITTTEVLGAVDRRLNSIPNP